MRQRDSYSSVGGMKIARELALIFRRMGSMLEIFSRAHPMNAIDYSANLIVTSKNLVAPPELPKILYKRCRRQILVRVTLGIRFRIAKRMRKP